MHKSIFVALVFSLSACAAGPAPRSGFLGDYSSLEKVTSSDSLIEHRPAADFDPRQFRAVYIEPTEVNVEGLSKADAAQLSSVFREALVKELDDALPVVDQNGSGVMRIRTAIVQARKANIGVNVLTSLLAMPISYGGVAAEAEVLDSNGKRIAALAWARRGAKITELGLSYTRLGDARSGLRTFAKRLAGLFFRAPDAEQEAQGNGN